MSVSALSKYEMARIPVIKDGLLKGKTLTQIGADCNRTERTVRRTIEKWVQTGDFDVWLKEEFLRLHYQMIHDDPVEAYRQISKLVGKSITRKLEAHTEHVETKKLLHLHMWMPAGKSGESDLPEA